MSTDLAVRATDLDLEHMSPLICMEIAAGLSSVEGVKEKYEISEAQWLRLEKNPTFLSMMKEARLAFSGDANAGARIKKKAEVLLEEALPILYRLMSSPEASTATVIDVVKQLTVLAEKGGRAGGQQAGGAAGGGFNVHIDIRTHDEPKQVVIQGN